MLQVLLERSDRYTLAEQAQMAIEGGATWLVVRPRGLSDEVLREEARELTAMCRDNAIILTIEGHTELAAELGLHGVLLLKGQAVPADIRALFGAEAIIGAEVADAPEAIALEKSDIDYAVITQLHGAAPIIEAARKAGSLIPFVAMGDFTAEESAQLVMAGFDGICTGRLIFAADDPVTAVGEYLDRLAGKKA